MSHVCVNVSVEERWFSQLSPVQRNQNRSDVCIQVLDVVHTLNCLSLYKDRSVFCLPEPPAIHRGFFGHVSIQDEILV